MGDPLIERNAFKDNAARDVAARCLPMLYSGRLTGSQLRNIRLRLGRTQAQFAKRFGFSRNTLVRLETGKQKIRPVVAIAARCLALHSKWPPRRGTKT
jgi:DNA-binding XRE family transcriptional regulator